MNDCTPVKARVYGSYLDLTEEELIELKKFWRFVLNRLNDKTVQDEDNEADSGLLSIWKLKTVFGGLESSSDLKVSSKNGKELKESLSNIIRCDHPDIVAVRYLKARKWKSKEAYKMLINSLDFYMSEEFCLAKKEGERGMNIEMLESNKNFFHGYCKDGNLIMYGDVAKDFPSKFKINEHFRNSFNIINESYYMLGNSPKMTLIYNMKGFSLANTDININRVLAKFTSDHHPEALHRVIILGAPWIFNSVWSVLCTFLDPVIKSKVIFSQDDQIKDYVDEDVLLSYLGGSNPYTHEYFPPNGDEGLIKPHDDEYFKLKGERAVLLNKFEESTYNWIVSNEEAIKLKRDELANELAFNHLKLDKYEYSGNIYRRLNVIKGYDNVNWDVLKAK